MLSGESSTSSLLVKMRSMLIKKPCTVFLKIYYTTICLQLTFLSTLSFERLRSEVAGLSNICCERAHVK